jgi:hypothetical protein
VYDLPLLRVQQVRLNKTPSYRPGVLFNYHGFAVFSIPQRAVTAQVDSLKVNRLKEETRAIKTTLQPNHLGVHSRSAIPARYQTT